MRKPSQKEEKHHRKPKIALIADFNGNKIIEYLKKDETREWTYINVTKTAKGLAQLKDDQGLMEELFRQDQVMIMMGTNDIRKGSRAETINRNTRKQRRTSQCPC